MPKFRSHRRKTVGAFLLDKRVATVPPVSVGAAASRGVGIGGPMFMLFNVRPFLRAAALFALGLCFASFAWAGPKDPYEVLAGAGLDRDIKDGYTLRADSWSGDLPADGTKRIEYTLLRGNDYHFYSFATTKGAKISFHVQDREGTVVETRSWQKDRDALCFAGAEIQPKSTGSYFLVIKVEQSPAERAEWSLVYAFK